MQEKNFFTVTAKNVAKLEAKNSDIFDNKSNLNNIFKASKPQQTKRLNAFDTELFKQLHTTPAQGDIESVSKSRLSELSEELGKVDKRINLAKFMKEDILVRDLQIERYKIVNQIELLKQQNQKTHLQNSPYVNFVHFTSNAIQNFSNQKQQMASFLEKEVFAKFLKPISKSIKLKEVISILNELNKNVDELSNLNIPYGESEERYKELEKYIFQATSMQALVQKEVKNNSFKF